jgi:hypothetical protein
MQDVAKMLGVEPNEEFEVDVGGIIVKAQITTDDIHLLNYDRHWGGYSADALLRGLLCGDYTIKHKPWKPQDDSLYYWVAAKGEVYSDAWTNCVKDINTYKLGNCYRTFQEAKANRDKWIAFYASDGILEV